MKNQDSCLVSLNHSLIYSKERNQVICLASQGTLVRYQIHGDISPQILEQKVFKDRIDIKPMDENRFFLFSEPECDLFILNWDDWNNFDCYELPDDEYYDTGNADAVFLPESNLVICGGSWNKVFFLDLNDGKISEAYEDFKTNYVRIFSLSIDHKYITHVDQDQDSSFVISSIDSNKKKIKKIARFYGAFREHKDCIAFSNSRKNEFGHVYFARNPWVSILRLDNNELIEIYKQKLLLIDDWERTYYIDKSTILSYGNSYLVASGNRVYEIIFNDGQFESKQILEYEEVINDMIWLSGNKFILGTNAGLKEERF